MVYESKFVFLLSLLLSLFIFYLGRAVRRILVTRNRYATGKKEKIIVILFHYWFISAQQTYPH